MLEYWPKAHTVDVIDSMDPRRDTGRVRQMISWGVFGMLINLATTLYTYLIVSHPLTICLAYLFVYCILGYFIINMEIQMQVLDKDNIPDRNPRIRYGKGKYKNTTVRPTKRGKRKGRPKPPPKKKKYRQRKKSYFDG